MMQEDIKKLTTEFIGKGEVKGFQFRQLIRGNNASLYEVTTLEDTIHYEVFEIKVFLTPKTKEPYEAYPKSNSFGVWAWTTMSLLKAVEIFNKIENNE